MPSSLPGLELLRAAAEIAVLAVLIYYVLKFLHGTRGFGILRGFVFLTVIGSVGVLWLTDQLQLVRIHYVLEHWFVPLLVVAPLVIFQPELRRALVRLGQNPFLRSFVRHKEGHLDEILTAVMQMAQKRTGALLAIERDVGLGGYIEAGTRTEAEVSRELLETIFHPGSPLHDGGVILQHDRVAAAGCLFPLSDNPDLAKSMGTRHRAALGLTEETDAVVILVSEETGKVALVVQGRILEDLDRPRLEAAVTALLARRPLQEPAPAPPGAPAPTPPVPPAAVPREVSTRS